MKHADVGLDILLAERSRRQGLEVGRYAKWRNDPVGFVHDRLLGFLWSKQREICESVLRNRLTAVPSCHDAGKSAIAARLASWWISVHPPGEAFVVTLAPTHHQVRGILWREINRVHAAGALPGRCNQTEWWIANELVGFGRSPMDNDPTAIQGIHARNVLVIVDEACGIARALADGFSSLYSNEFSRCLAIGNPDDPTTWFADICKPGSGWNTIRIDAFETPNFTTEPVPDWLRPLLVSPIWVTERRREWGEGSMRWMSKVRGQFPEQASDALIPLSALLAAVERGKELAIPDHADVLGVDVARFGADSTAIWARLGGITWKHGECRKRDTMYVVGRIVQAIRQLRPSRVHVDDAGLGGGVTDRLVELQANREIPATIVIYGINVGEAPKTNVADERFKNLRAEVNWCARTKFVENTITLVGGEELDPLLSQAGQILQKPTSAGEIVIEPKHEMKKRTNGVSPDDWDALVLCHAAPNWTGEGVMEHYAQQATRQRAEQERASATAPAPGNPIPQPAPLPEPQNYLGEVYTAGLGGFAPRPPTCKNCGKPLGITRTSDGFEFWHQPGDKECRRG